MLGNHNKERSDNMTTVGAGIVALLMFGLGYYIGSMVYVND